MIVEANFQVAKYCLCGILVTQEQNVLFFFLFVFFQTSAKILLEILILSSP